MKIHNYKKYTAQELRKKVLEQLSNSPEKLPDSLNFYRNLLLVQSRYHKHVLSTDISRLAQRAPGLLSRGKPILDFPDMHMDRDNLSKLFQSVSQIARSHLQPSNDENDELKQLGIDVDLLVKKAQEWFKEGTLQLIKKTTTIKIMPLTASVLQGTLQPVLADYADLLFPLVEQKKWLKQYCPVCGGRPDFAYISSDRKRSRWLICSRCDSHWLYYLVTCPYCGNSERDMLAFYSDKTKTYRLYVCENCKKYIKAIDHTKVKNAVLLPLERVLTLDLDRQAYAAGYHAE